MFLAATQSLWGQATVVKKSQTDIFLITIDTLRADHVHCYGYSQGETPALDGLAKAGIRFDQAVTPSPLTNTSHTSILTGLLPSVHGVTDFAVPLAPTHKTWAELLKQRGYHTAAFIGAAILDKTLAPGLDRGFDFYDNFPAHTQNKSRWGRLERRGMVVVQRAEAWLNRHPAGPHFVWVHLYDPHDPYEPPPPYLRAYKDRLYDGEIAYADSALGHFLRYLKRRNWYSQALIVAVSDHGEGLGEHHEDTHGIFLYDTTLLVPLIMKLPGGRHAGKVVAPQVRTLDLLPTVLDLLGLAEPDKLDGQSLRAYLEGEQAAGRTAYGETDYPLHFGWAPLRSIREEGFKFIEAPRPELYNLNSDPQEGHDQYVPWDPTVQKLRGALAELRTKLPAPQQASAGAVSKGTTDELRALGYLGPADALGSTNVPEPSLLPDPKDKIQEQNLLHAAMLASEDGRADDARSALSKILQEDPKSPTALLQLGELELDSGNNTKAVYYLKRAQEVRPDDAAAAFYHGQALSRIPDLDGARAALEKSLQLQPGQFRARLLLGEVFLKLENPQAAEDQLQAALLLEPRSPTAQFELAKAMVANREYADAETQLRSLSKIQPNNPELYEWLAKAYSGLGNNREAEEAKQRAGALKRGQRGTSFQKSGKSLVGK
jgi:arylsulfatase A-like enzyme/Flp pilus assembly protein TadD